MVSFLGRRVPKVGSNLFTFVAISVQDGSIIGDHPGEQVSVTRPSMEAMYEDFGDFDDVMPELMDSESEEEDSYMLPFTPRVALGDVFEQLDTGFACLGTCSQQGFGWSAADVGGHGLRLADYFTGETAGSKDTQPSSSSRPTVKLGDIEWAGVHKLHPNKIFTIVIEYIIGRWPDFARRRRAIKKQDPLRHEFAQFAREPLKPLKQSRITWRDRGDAYYSMCTWISRLSGRGIRPVRKEMHEEWIQNGKWTSLDDSVKYRFHFLKLLEKELDFQDAIPEVSTRPNGRSSQASFAVVGRKAAEPLPVTNCYGWLATYNTDLGLQDPEILQWVQQGLRGNDLAAKLKEHDLIKNAFNRFLSFHKDRAEQHGFKTWAVALEHSMNAKHPARVHLHTYAGVDIRGGHLLMGAPSARPVSKSGLTFPGCEAPHVRFTTFRRSSTATILNGVSTGMYYVAGAKESSIMVQASMTPIQEQRKCVRFSTLCETDLCMLLVRTRVES